jgi:DNA-binding ferritin-like protein
LRLEGLNARLADSIDLMQQAKQAYWNVKGSSFIALHTLFDAVVDAAEAYMDPFAERVVQLGGTAEGLAQKQESPQCRRHLSSTLCDRKDQLCKETPAR